VARVHLASAAEADEAAARASEAAPAFARLSTDERRRLLRAVAERLSTDVETFAGVIRDEAGKPVTQARAEVRRAAEVFQLAAGEAERSGGRVVPVDFAPGNESLRCLVRPFPRGPALAIGPFNFPLNLLAHKVAPALAAGCPIVVKPPPQAPTAGLMLGELIASLAPGSWPAGFLSVLPCDADVAAKLSADARFKVVSFTGSERVGWQVRAAASRAHTVLELGGDAAVIVCADADLEAAARRIAWGASAHAGQVCVSVQRILVASSVRARFESLLVEAFRDIATGDPAEGAVVCGPVIDDAAADRVDGLIASAGRRLVGGERHGRLFTPALLTDVDAGSPLASDEAFGPVAGLWSFDRFEEALSMVNGSRFGLQAGLYTHDLGRVFDAHETLLVGGLVVNDVPTLRVDSYPYGGTKGSGLCREGGVEGLGEYLEPRVLLIRT
jgi:glyceraldehyde-3-phosphate dehydrogenase (NADP+)